MLLPSLQPGILLKRYKRFLADIKLDNGSYITAFCPNSGSMLTCKEPGSPVMVSYHDKPGRKHAYTWEMIKINDGWVGINTHRPNILVSEAIAGQQIPELAGYTNIRREVAYGANSRIDILLEKPNQLCYVEVKNVTLVRHGIIEFPDAVTSRGTKHLNELMEMVNQGHRAVMFYLVQRPDGDWFRPARDIDPVYAETLKKATAHGVEMLVYRAAVTPEEISITCPLKFNLE